MYSGPSSKPVAVAVSESLSGSLVGAESAKGSSRVSMTGRECCEGCLTATGEREWEEGVSAFRVGISKYATGALEWELPGAEPLMLAARPMDRLALRGDGNDDGGDRKDD